MDYKSGFTFVFEDPNWLKKMLMAAAMVLLSIFIIPGLALAGYIVKTIRNVAEAVEHPLPEWTDWGELISTGFKMFVTGLVFAIPFIVVLIFFLALVIMGPIALGEDSELGGIIAIVFMILFEITALLVNIIVYLLTPAVIMQFAKTNSISETVKPKNIWSIIKLNPSDYIVISLLGIALHSIASFGFIVFIVGVFFTAIYAELVKAHLLGQYLRIHAKDQNAREQEDNAIDSCYNPSISSITD
jgi:hypothetical protein